MFVSTDVFILRGWGIVIGVFGSCFLKIWIAGVEQCSCALRDSDFYVGGGGWVGFSYAQNDLSQTPHMDTESVD